MGERYAVGLQQTGVSTVAGATGTDAVGELLAATTVRARIYDLILGHGGTPADNVIRWEVPRQTTSATGTAAVENPLDAGSPPALILTEEEITAGPTVTADSQVLDFDLNQRATFRWVAAPGGEIIIPATATNGVFLNASSSAYTGIARATVHWEEKAPQDPGDARAEAFECLCDNSLDRIDL